MGSFESSRKTFQCNLCASFFRSFHERHLHFERIVCNNKTKEKRTVLNCSLCKKEFDDYKTRHNHFTKEHSKKKVYHKSIVHGIHNKSIACQYCNKNFHTTESRSEHYLESHINHSEKNSGCRNDEIIPSQHSPLESKIKEDYLKEEYGESRTLESTGDLPEGWTRFVYQRKTGEFIYQIKTGDGKMFRSQKQLSKYIEEENLPWTVMLKPP